MRKFNEKRLVSTLFLGFEFYIDGKNDRNLVDNLQWGLATSIFLTSDIKSSDRIETVPSFITNDQSLGPSENISIGWE